MKILRYLAGLILVLLLICADVMIGQNLLSRWFYIFMAALSFGVFALLRAASGRDRLLSFKAAGLAATGLCFVLAMAFNSDIYLDIAVCWALQSYAAILYISGNLEGGGTDD